MEFTPNLLKHMLNLYPPYLGAGVKVTYISKERDEEDELVARVKKTIYVRKKKHVSEN